MSLRKPYGKTWDPNKMIEGTFYLNLEIRPHWFSKIEPIIVTSACNVHFPAASLL
jgi:hypothetical protein